MRVPNGKAGWSLDDLWRRRLPAPPTPVAQPQGFAGVRLSFEEAEASMEATADRLALPRSVLNGDEFNVLAISGGAAGGAYGAGALVGLSEAGRRPRFSIVTGVSTGALIAPFAFLGSGWDARLTEAYTGGHAADRFGFGALSGVLDGGLLSTDSLDDLIAPFVDAEMLEAIAAEHRLGRRLLVATTDLDSQSPAIWDMGEIAMRGGDSAVAMFRLVLAASASLPGLFPPRLIRCEVDGALFDELHVDGGVIAPLFILPDALLRWRRLGRRLRRGRVYALFNTVIDSSPQTTSVTLPAILIRSFDTMLRVSYRQALNVATAFCVGHNIPLSFAAVPAKPAAAANGTMLDFDTQGMRANFEAGRASARGDMFWSTPAVRLEPWEQLLDFLRP
jgi:hypothetical protein